MYNINDTIRNFREQLNLKQSYVADQIGMCQANYSKVEQGQIHLTTETLYKISKAMDVRLVNIVVSHELGVVIIDKEIVKILRPLILTEEF